VGKKKKKAAVEKSIPVEISAALALAFVAAPLVWTRTVYSIYVLPKFLLIAAAALLAGVAALRSGEPNGSAGSGVEKSLGAVWLVLVISAIFSVEPYVSFLGRYNDHAYGLAAFALYTLAFIWGAGMPDETRKRFLFWAIAGAAVVGVVAVFQKAGVRPLLKFPLPGGRAVSTIGSPVHLGAYLSAALVLAVPLRGEGRRGARWFCAAAAAAGLFVSFSRGAWLAGAVGLSVAFAAAPLLRGRVDSRRIPLIAVAGVVLIVLAALGFSRFRAVGASDALRMEAWRTSISMVQERPLFGSGLDTFGTEFRRRKSPEFVRIGGETLRHEHAHNDILQAATTTGTVGLIAYAAFLIAFLLEFFKRWEDAPLEARACAARFAGASAAVFAAAKFNPMSIEVHFLAAAAAGASLSALGTRRIESESGAALRAGGAALAGTVCSAVVLWLCVADAYSQKARTGAGSEALNAHRRAAKTNPCETQYARRYVNRLIDLARENRSNPARFEFLDEARAAIERTVGCRPGSFQARYASGFVALLEAQLGRPDRLAAARREIEAARELDPTFAPLLRLGADAARSAADAGAALEYEKAAAELAR
jgi:O-antigen ligase